MPEVCCASQNLQNRNPRSNSTTCKSSTGGQSPIFLESTLRSPQHELSTLETDTCGERTLRRRSPVVALPTLTGQTARQNRRLPGNATKLRWATCLINPTKPFFLPSLLENQQDDRVFLRARISQVSRTGNRLVLLRSSWSFHFRLQFTHEYILPSWHSWSPD